MRERKNERYDKNLRRLLTQAITTGKSKRAIGRDANVSNTSICLFLNKNRGTLTLETASKIVESLPFSQECCDLIKPDHATQYLSQTIQETDALYVIGNEETNEALLELIEKQVQRGMEYKRLVPQTRESGQMRSHYKELAVIPGNFQIRQTTTANLEQNLYVSKEHTFQKMATGDYVHFQGEYNSEVFIEYFHRLFDDAKPYDFGQLVN